LPNRLPFKHIWHGDFEFTEGNTGNRLAPLCATFYEERSHRLIQLWQDEMGPGDPPILFGRDSVFCGHLVSAEARCFDVLGWPQPTYVLDTFVLHRLESNGKIPPTTKGESRNSLSAVLERRGLGSIAPTEKKMMREWIAAGGPFSIEDRRKIQDYNADDVRVLPPLLQKYQDWLLQDRHLFTALAYGRYMVAVGRMENFGIPIDMALHERIERHKAAVLQGLIAEIDARFGVFKGDVFSLRLFKEWLQREGIEWLYLDSRLPSTRDEVFKEQEHLHPDLPELRQLLKTKRQMAAKKKESPFPIGNDSRARTMLSPFASKTGRNQPRRFIFGAPKWRRIEIAPKPGRALIYADWVSQELFLAAYLSGDKKLLEAAASGDAYLAFAKQIGMVPPDATKQSHPRERAICKVLTLGLNYGMGYRRLAKQAQIPDEEALNLIKKRAALYPAYTAWSEEAVAEARNGIPLTSRLGWTLHTSVKAYRAKPTTAKNYKMQANGAELMRLACSLAVEDGLMICCPVHDALLAECAENEIEETKRRLRAAMDTATRMVLGGEATIPIEMKIYSDRNENLL
jgi:DNA polymerase I